MSLWDSTGRKHQSKSKYILNIMQNEFIAFDFTDIHTLLNRDINDNFSLFP